jgi:hypothetical protein
MPGLVPAVTTTSSRRLKNKSSPPPNTMMSLSPNNATMTTTTHASDGWDNPPAVASPASLNESNKNYGNWIPRACHWKTPQRLFTLDPSAKNSNSNSNHPRHKDNNSNNNNNGQQQPKDFTGGNLLCAPIVVSNKYVVVASDSFLSVYGNFDDSQDNNNDHYNTYEESMQRNINTIAIPPLTTFSLSDSDTTDESFDFGDQIKQISYHEETGIVYVLTVESCIFQVKLMVDDLGVPTSSSESSNADASSSSSKLKTDTGSRSTTRDSLSDDSRGDSGATPTSTNTTNPATRTTQQLRVVPRFHLMHNWVTKRLGATCMATLNDGGGIGIDTVCVGYKSGHIEAWNVHQKITPRDRQLQKKGGRKGNSVSLDWEGFLHDSIRTLSFLSRGSNEAPQTKTESRRSEMDTPPGQHGKGGSLGKTTKASPRKDSTEGTTGKARDEHYYYLMAIVSISTRIGDKGKQQPTYSMLKVLDLKWIANEMRKNNADPSSSSSSSSHAGGLSLENYSLPQTRGMELIEATTVSLSKDSRLPKRVPILDSHGMNAACNIKSAEPPGGLSSSSCMGITFPDGIIGMFSSRSRDTFDAVGIMRPDHQVLLSYPAIGNGQINITDKSGKHSSYLAACLRGGTCYLIPISSKNKSNNNNNSIATVPFPHDIESDLSDIYVQAFTAGNLVVDGINLPILIYAWPGGVIDVYSCGLMGSKAPNNRDESEIIVDDDDDPNDSLVSRAERRCLRDLSDDESISLIAKIIDELREDSQNPLLQMEEWQQLLTEIRAGKALPASEEDITADSLCSSEYQSLRRILLSLALVVNE